MPPPRAAPIALLAVALGASVPASAQSPGSRAAAPVLHEEPVDGTSIRRVAAETLIHAPFERVAARLLDYGRYPEFMPRFQSARVVRRNRAETDVYFRLELPRAMGVLWFLHRLTVVRRTPDSLEIVGFAQSGNAGRVETRCVLERAPGDRRATRMTFALFGVPVFPALPDAVTTTLRDAVRGASVLLQASVEREVQASATP